MRSSITLCLTLWVGVVGAFADTLTCAQINKVLTQESALDVRPFCDTAEVRCKALQILEGKPVTDPLRQMLEVKLRAQVQYELEVCELMLRQANPDYLNPREE